MQHKNILVMGENSYNMVGRSEAMAVFGNLQFRVNSQPTFDDGLVFINSFFSHISIRTKDNYCGQLIFRSCQGKSQATNARTKRMIGERVEKTTYTN